MRHWSTVSNKMWDKKLWKGALKLHKSASALQKCTNIGKFCKIIAPALTHQLAWHFRRFCRSQQDCATKGANHLSTGNVGQHIMPVHVLLLSSYAKSTLVKVALPTCCGGDLFKHVSWENLTKSTPADNMATIQWFFIWNELESFFLHLSVRHQFLAVQDSSIGDIVSQSVSKTFDLR